MGLRVAQRSPGSCSSSLAARCPMEPAGSSSRARVKAMRADSRSPAARAASARLSHDRGERGYVSVSRTKTGIGNGQIVLGALPENPVYPDGLSQDAARDPALHGRGQPGARGHDVRSGGTLEPGGSPPRRGAGSPPRPATPCETMPNTPALESPGPERPGLCKEEDRQRPEEELRRRRAAPGARAHRQGHHRAAEDVQCRPELAAVLLELPAQPARVDHRAHERARLHAPETAVGSAPGAAELPFASPRLKRRARRRRARRRYGRARRR